MSAALPVSVCDHQASGVLEIVWDDTRRSRLPHAWLRSQCRCAGCEQQRRRHGSAPTAAPGLRLSGIEPVGEHGLNLVFSDGHGRGIYPWPYLRELGDNAPASLQP